ncbi:MAG: hypothetical protein WC657_01310 [Candidatus Paceibacterota bacterium]|jgi:hypothetical protein
MPRIQFSDVTPPDNRRSIRDIPIPNSGKRKVPTPVNKPGSINITKIEPVFQKEPEQIKPVDSTETGPYEYYYPKEKTEPKQIDNFPKKSKKPLFFGALTVALVGVFVVLMMTVFASATISITPKSQTVEVDTQIVGVAGELAENTVRYEILKLSESKTASIPTTDEQAVELKASGKIIIYNDFSAEPQRLIVRTRFENPDGFIFRIAESVIIPGKTIKAGVETPGSIEVEIFADEAGEKYNIKKTDFTIPGFKSDATRFKKFYAKSTTDMTGGFIGKKKIADPTAKQAALTNIDSEAQINLKKSLTAKIPEGLTVIEGSIVFNSKELATKDESSSVVVGKEITAYAIMLNKQDLSKIITEQYISKSPDWQNIRSIVSDFSLLKIKTPPQNFDNNTRLNLEIIGPAEVIADIDTDAIKTRLLGAPKKDAAQLIKEYNGISGITSIIKPIWKQSFPTSPSKIYVQTVTHK